MAFGCEGVKLKFGKPKIVDPIVKLYERISDTDFFLFFPRSTGLGLNRQKRH
jgi:hypothetical protein